MLKLNLDGAVSPLIGNFERNDKDRYFASHHHACIRIFAHVICILSSSARSQRMNVHISIYEVLVFSLFFIRLSTSYDDVQNCHGFRHGAIQSAFSGFDVSTRVLGARGNQGLPFLGLSWNLKGQFLFRHQFDGCKTWPLEMPCVKAAFPSRGPLGHWPRALLVLNKRRPSAGTRLGANAPQED